MIRVLFISLYCVTLSVFSIAQDSYTISDENASKISVTGTSSLTDWEVTAADVSDFPSSINISFDEDTGLEQFGFKVLVESMDGGRGASMNKKINKSLKATDHPHIIFNATDVEIIPSDTEDENTLKVKGEVEIAGQKKEIDLDVQLKLSDDQLTISGFKKLQMSEFGIEPPTAMFGQIKTGDEITVHFNFSYSK